MPFSAQELATRLLNRPLTEARVMKTRRHLARQAWSTPQIMDAEKVILMLDAIETDPRGGPAARAFVHQTLVEGPPRVVPPLPEDIAEQVKQFHIDRAKVLSRS